jgi:hypothetical protein
VLKRLDLELDGVMGTSVSNMAFALRTQMKQQVLSLDPLVESGRIFAKGCQDAWLEAESGKLLLRSP